MRSGSSGGPGSEEPGDVAWCSVRLEDSLRVFSRWSGFGGTAAVLNSELAFLLERDQVSDFGINCIGKLAAIKDTQARRRDLVESDSGSC